MKVISTDLIPLSGILDRSQGAISTVIFSNEWNLLVAPLNKKKMKVISTDLIPNKWNLGSVTGCDFYK